VRRGASSGLALNMVTQIFNVGVHRAGSVASEDGSRALFQVVDSTTPAFDPEAAELNNIVGDVKRGLDEDVIAQYLAKLENDIGVKLNSKVYSAATGVSPADF
jgi:peptidyl-prolyl cis-trans isomerase D